MNKPIQSENLFAGNGYAGRWNVDIWLKKNFFFKLKHLKFLYFGIFIVTPT